jgi:hypothetical protein
MTKSAGYLVVGLLAMIAAEGAPNLVSEIAFAVGALFIFLQALISNDW